MSETEPSEDDEPEGHGLTERESLGELVERLPEREREVLYQSLEMSRRTGPLPTAEEFAGYGDALESAPDRILSMAEKSLDHRIRRDDRIGRGDLILSVLGLVFAFVLAVFVLGGSMWLVNQGHTVAGTILATLDLLALVTIFITRRSGSS